MGHWDGLNALSCKKRHQACLIAGWQAALGSPLNRDQGTLPRLCPTRW